MIALVVSLQVKEDSLEQFLEAITENAERSFGDEAGCHYFDVSRDRADPTRFILYEIYEDEAAIEAHRASPHYAEWRKAADACIVEGGQVNTFCDRLIHHS